MALPEAVNNASTTLCREIITTFERNDRIHPFSPYTMFISKRQVPMGMEMSNSEAMRVRNPGRGYTPRAESLRSELRSSRSASATTRPAWNNASSRPSSSSGRGGARPAARDSRPRLTWSKETRGVGLGYKIPERLNPDVGGEERDFRNAFNNLPKKQKQKFVQSLYFNQYKSFEKAPGGPRLVTDL